MSCEDIVYESVKIWVKYHGADSGSVYLLMQEVQWPLVLDIDGIVEDIKAIIKHFLSFYHFSYGCFSHYLSSKAQ